MVLLEKKLPHGKPKTQRGGGEDDSMEKGKKIREAGLSCTLKINAIKENLHKSLASFRKLMQSALFFREKRY